MLCPNTHQKIDWANSTNHQGTQEIGNDGSPEYSDGKVPLYCYWNKGGIAFFPSLPMAGLGYREYEMVIPPSLLSS
jgi:hypothetical protein